MPWLKLGWEGGKRLLLTHNQFYILHLGLPPYFTHRTGQATQCGNIVGQVTGQGERGARSPGPLRQVAEHKRAVRQETHRGADARGEIISGAWTFVLLYHSVVRRR